jgi:hypothetical protein
VRELRPEVPKEVSEAIMACREASLDWRPKDLGYLVEVVRKVRGPGAPRMPRASAGRAAQAPRLGAPATSQGGPPIAAIAGVLVLLAAGAGWFFLRGRGPQAAPVAPTTTLAPTTTTAPAALPSPSLEPTPASSATPAPTAVPSPTPAAVTTTTTLAQAPRPVPTATPVPTTVATPPPTTAPPAPTPAATPAAVASATPVTNGPAVLKTLSPPTLRRGGRQLVDVRGSGLTPNHNPTLLKGKAIVAGLTVTGARFVNEGLLQVFIQVDAAVPTGAYVLLLTDGEGRQTNALRFDVK